MTTLKTRARIFVLVIFAAFPALLFTVYRSRRAACFDGKPGRARRPGTSCSKRSLGCSRARFAGATILPETGLDAAVGRAEVIRLAIARLVLSHTGTPLGKITTSLGIALFPDHGEDSDALLRAADVALHAAKGAGRDRVVVGSAEKR